MITVSSRTLVSSARVVEGHGPLLQEFEATVVLGRADIPKGDKGMKGLCGLMSVGGWGQRRNAL